MFGLGLEGLNSHVDLAWCALEDNSGGGVLFGHKAEVHVVGGLIRGPASDPSVEGATGLSIGSASVFEGKDITISGSHGFGVVASELAAVDFATSVVAHTVPDEGGFFGVGMLAVTGAGRATSGDRQSGSAISEVWLPTRRTTPAFTSRDANVSAFDRLKPSTSATSSKWTGPPRSWSRARS